MPFLCAKILDALGLVLERSGYPVTPTRNTDYCSKSAQNRMCEVKNFLSLTQCSCSFWKKCHIIKYLLTSNFRFLREYQTSALTR